MKGKTGKRLASFLLPAVVVILSASITLSLVLLKSKTTVSADTASDLIIGDNVVDLNGDEPQILAFVPEETGSYIFTALNTEVATSAELWEASQFSSADGEYIAASNNRYDGPVSNFRLMAELTADETYVLVCWNNHESEYDYMFDGRYHYDCTTTVRVTSYTADPEPNRCGKNATWAFDSGSGTLTISGTGAMYDKYDYLDNQFPWESIKSSVTSVVISNGITCIGCEAFSGFSNLTSVVIPPSVTDIRYAAFQKCTLLTSVTIPYKVKEVGTMSFWGCSSLSSVTIPGSVKKIGMGAFTMCEEMQSLTINEGVKEIACKAFSSCSSLTSVTTPKSLTSLGYAAFSDCLRLQSATIPSGNIGHNAFLQCASLKNVSIGEDVGLIGGQAFTACRSLESVTLEEGVKHIGGGAFYDCRKLTSITIPGSVISIGKYVFIDSQGLQMFEENTPLGNAFYKCGSLTNVYCYANPDKLEWYGDSAETSFLQSSEEKTKCHVFSEYESAYATKFNQVNVDFVGDLPNEIDLGLGETLYGYSVTVSSNIGVNCYMDFDPDTLSEDAYMLFSIPSGSNTTYEKVYIRDIVSENNKRTVGDKSYYILTCKISAKDIASTVSAQLIDRQNEGLVYKFSVKTYAEYLIAHQDDPQYSAAAPVARAMLVYGTWAQKYFKVSPETIDNSLLNESELSDVSITPPQTDIQTPEGVTFKYSTISLKAETTLSLYFSSEEELTFSCSGMLVETDLVNGYQVARIRGIAPHMLDKTYHLKVSCASGEGYVEYSPLNYCYNIINGDYVDDIKNAVRALYKYYEASKTFIINGGSDNA